MEYSAKTFFKWLVCALLLTAVLPSCGMMEDDLSDCPYGLYLTFKYDYNLERADMFNDHVGSVTLYIFDADERLVAVREESNAGGVSPLKDKNYSMHITDLAPGVYKFIALAGQRPYADMMADNRAKFVRSDMPSGCGMSSLGIQLDRVDRGDGVYDVVNNSLPLDSLWHGMETGGFEVSATSPTYGTISLMRDTKKINVTMRELDDPTEMDIANYEMTITDRNSTLLWDNSVDETTGTVVYRPYVAWNTYDRTPASDPDGNPLDDAGKIGHAEFMTSRIVYHDNPADDGVLLVKSRLTGKIVASLNLPDVLSRLSGNDDMHRYTPQEFLDRGYDYQIDLFLKGDKWAYLNVGISVLGWSKRIQAEEL